jgi:hypothetical protein
VKFRLCRWRTQGSCFFCRYFCNFRYVTLWLCEKTCCNFATLCFSSSIYMVNKCVSHTVGQVSGYLNAQLVWDCRYFTEIDALLTLCGWNSQTCSRTIEIQLTFP